MSRDRRLARDWVVPAVACAAYLAIGLAWLRFVYLSDFFQMVWLADAQRQGVATAFANGFLGMGYPLVLNGLRSLTGNILTSGKIVQALSGGAILAMLPLLSRQAFGDAKGSRLAQVLLAVDAVFLFAAAGETPDLLATAFMIGGLAVAAAYIAQPSARLAFGAGVLVGVGYLVRYHALLLLPWLMIAMAALAKERRRTVLWALAGFALAASPQLIASGMIQGNPLFNLHIKSVSMGYYGVSSDFVEKTRPYTLVSVLMKDPAHVFKQYVGFVIRYFTEIGGGLLLLAGAVLARRNELRGWSLLALPAMALTLLLAAKFYTDRAILFQLVVWYMVIGRTLAHLMAAGEAATTRLIAVTLALALSGSSIVQAGRTWSRFASLERRNVEITQILRANRIGSSREVFTTHLSYYLADDPGGGPFYPHDTWLLYDPAYARGFPHAYLSDLPSLNDFVKRHRIRFLLLGPLTGELSDTVYQAQRAGTLGPAYRLLKSWGDLWLYEYVEEGSQSSRSQSS